MVDSPKKEPGLMDQISGMGNEYFGDAVFGDQLDKLATEKHDLVKEILLSMRDLAKLVIDEEGRINLEALRKHLTLTEKFSLMAKIWIAENLSDTVMDGVVGKGKKIETTTFADTFVKIKKENTLNDENIYWPTLPGNIGKGSMLWNLKGQVDKGETLKFMTGSTLVMPTDGSGESVFGLDVTAALQIGLLKHGITLKTYGAKETSVLKDLPGDKEIQIVFAPAEGLPMKADGTVDVESVKNFAELFKRGQVQWFANPLLMASIFAVVHPVTDVSGTGEHIQRMMTKFGLSSEEDKKQLTELFPAIPPLTQTEPIATPTPVAPAVTAEVPAPTTPAPAPTDAIPAPVAPAPVAETPKP